MKLFRKRAPEQLVPPWVPHVYAALLGHIEKRLDRMEKAIMSKLDDLQAKADQTLTTVTAETDLDNAIAKVIDDKNAQIADLKAQLDAAGTDPAKLAALGDTMDQILSLSTSNSKIISDAVVANTPAATPTT